MVQRAKQCQSLTCMLRPIKAWKIQAESLPLRDFINVCNGLRAGSLVSIRSEKYAPRNRVPAPATLDLNRPAF
jgi:hypothetical protein